MNSRLRTGVGAEQQLMFDDQYFYDQRLVRMFVAFAATVDGLVEQSLRADLKGGVLSPDEVTKLFNGVISEVSSITGTLKGETYPFSAFVISEFEFLLVAWADEAIIRACSDKLDFPEHGGLERRVYGTSNAGEQFFRTAEAIVERNRSEESALAAAYLVAILIGFAGRHLEDHGNSSDLKKITAGLRSNCIVSYHARMTSDDTEFRPGLPQLPVWRRPIAIGLVVVMVVSTVIGALTVVWSNESARLSAQLTDLGLSLDRPVAQRNGANND